MNAPTVFWPDGQPVNARTVIERLGKPVRVHCRCAPNGVVSGNIRPSDGISAVYKGRTLNHCPACGRYWEPHPKKGSMTTYAVRCADHETKPVRTRADAERQLQRIEDARVCRLAHEVVEVTK